MIQNNDYKRKTRQMPLEVLKKIGDALRGRKKSYTHSQNISKGLKEKYWSQIPKSNDSNI